MSNQLAIPLKPTLPIPIHQSLQSYIRENIPDTHPEAFRWDIERWEQLRNEAYIETVHISRTQALIKYIVQLTFILTKLPVDIGLDISYHSAFLPSDAPVTLRNLAYERAATLFNLAALYSQLALVEDRTHPDGIKRASAYYQNAAGTLSYLIASALPALTQTLEVNTRIEELSESPLRSLEFLMLAQAQECAWQRAVIDHYKNGLVAKLSAKVASYYRLAYNCSQELTASQALPPEWIAHINTKQLHFEAAAQFRKSMDDVEVNKYGLEVSRLLEAKSLAKKGFDIARRALVSKPVLNDIKSLLDTLENNISRAERDNDLIYHHDVPPPSALPAIQDISMVQSIIPSSLQDPKTAVGSDGVIFGSLIGWGAKVAIEIYRDRVRNWVKEEVINRVTELDFLADSTLKELNLPACLEALDKPVGLPPSLLRKAEEIKLDDGPIRIDTTLETAEYMSQRCREILDQAMDILDQEASEDEGIRKNARKDGKNWDRMPSYEANVDLTNKEKRYRKMLTDASNANETVRSKWEQWEEPIIRLTWDDKELQKWVPSSTAKPPNRKDPSQAQTQAHARALRLHLEALADLRSARAELALRAKRLVDVDDITPRIMNEATAFELWTKVEPAMFEDTLDAEMQKYEKFKDGVEVGADKQVDLLDLIRNCHGKFIESRRQDPSIQDRERALQSLDLAYHKYREIIRNLDEGIEFYNGLSNILVQFRDVCKDWVRSRRDEMRWLSQSLDALHIDEDDLPTPKVSNGPLRPLSPDKSDTTKPESRKALGVAIELPPPDSDEWEVALPSPRKKR